MKLEQDIIGAIGAVLFFFVHITSFYQYFVPNAYSKYFTPFYSNYFYTICYVFFLTWFPVIWLYIQDKKIARNAHTMNLSQIVSNPRLLEKFKEVTKNYWCPESLLFFVDATHYTNSTFEKKEELGREIIEKYIRVDAILEVNIDHGTRTAILTAAQNNNFSDHLFSSAIK